MKKRLIHLVMIFTLLFGLLSIETGFAAAATVSLSGGGTYEKGDSFNVTLSYSGDTFGAATAKITYDSSILEYKSCSGAEAYGSGGTVTVTMSNGSGTKSLSCKLKFTAKKSGSSYVTASTSDVYNLDMEELSAETKSVKVSVKNTQAAASTNANLSSLLISSGNLSPGFSPSTTSYTVRVDHNVTVCTISAKTADSKATYQVTGSKNLSVGSNVRKVIVTAESGKTKTYTIQILRADSDGKIEEPDKDKENDKDKEDDKKEEAIKVSIGKTEYILVDDLTGIEIPEGFSMCIVTYEGKDLSGIENQDKDVTLCLLQNEDGEQDWYFFDKEKEAFTKTQRFTPAQIFSYVKENTVYTTNEDVSEKEQESGFLEKMDSTDFLLLCLGGTVGLLLIIVLIILIINLKRRK